VELGVTEVLERFAESHSQLLGAGDPQNGSGSQDAPEELCVALAALQRMHSPGSILGSAGT